MSRAHHRKQRFKLKSFYIWHRYMGVGAAFFTLILTITGILLNHTEQLRFDERFISSDLLLNWYGIDTPMDITTFKTGSVKVSQLGEQLYFGQTKLPGYFENLQGAVAINDLIIIAVNNGLSLYTAEGERVEDLKTTTIDLAAISKIGIQQNQLLIQANDSLYATDSSFLQFRKRDKSNSVVQWSTASAPTKDYVKTIRSHYHNDILPLERVILDIHSGRIAGTIGVWLMDIAAILLVLLSLTGLWMWLKRRR